MMQPPWYPRPKPLSARLDPIREDGEVYFLYACNQVKIGFSRRTLSRALHDIAPYCPSPMFLLGTIQGGFPDERRLHDRFADDRRDGEWFALSQELREFLCEDEDRSRKLTAAEEHYFEWLLGEIEIQKENPMNEFAETRSMLKKLAVAHGAETPMGHACHNLLEMTENYAKSSDEEQKRQLTANIEREKTRLNSLISQAH